MPLGQTLRRLLCCGGNNQVNPATVRIMEPTTRPGNLGGIQVQPAAPTGAWVSGVSAPGPADTVSIGSSLTSASSGINEIFEPAPAVLEVVNPSQRFQEDVRGLRPSDIAEVTPPQRPQNSVPATRGEDGWFNAEIPHGTIATRFTVLEDEAWVETGPGEGFLQLPLGTQDRRNYVRIRVAPPPPRNPEMITVSDAQRADYATRVEAEIARQAQAAPETITITRGDWHSRDVNPIELFERRATLRQNTLDELDKDNPNEWMLIMYGQELQDVEQTLEMYLNGEIRRQLHRHPNARIDFSFDPNAPEPTHSPQYTIFSRHISQNPNHPDWHAYIMRLRLGNSAFNNVLRNLEESVADPQVLAYMDYLKTSVRNTVYAKLEASQIGTALPYLEPGDDPTPSCRRIIENVAREIFFTTRHGEIRSLLRNPAISLQQAINMADAHP